MRLAWRFWAAIATVSVAAFAEEPRPPPETSQGRNPAPRAPEHDLGPLRLSVDLAKVDLKEHKLEARLSRDARRIRLKVKGQSGTTLAEVDQDISGMPAGAPIVVEWTPSSDETVAKIEVEARDAADAFARFVITPSSWSISIPHEEVNFKTNSAQIEESEKPKLEASYLRMNEALSAHREIGAVTLYLAGHTDTVGTDAHNFGLSMQRARAIALWFRQRGLSIAVAYEGFGESALLVKTADEVAEPKNRRVEYILALAEPTIATSGFRPAWKRLR